MNKLLIPHHSVSDWDFTHGTLYRFLDTTQWVSSPTSLRMKYTTTPNITGCILSNLVGCQNIPQGELRTWYRAPYVGSVPFNFRNQDTSTTPSQTNCYAVNISNLYIRLLRIVGGVATTIGDVPFTWQANTWFHLRVKFWNGVNLSGEDSLCAEIYQEVGGAWVKLGDTLYDNQNKWKGSGVNRLGLRYQTDSSMPNWFDDTEIWGPV